MDTLALDLILRSPPSLKLALCKSVLGSLALPDKDRKLAVVREVDRRRGADEERRRGGGLCERCSFNNIGRGSESAVRISDVQSHSTRTDEQS